VPATINFKSKSRSVIFLIESLSQFFFITLSL
jgi:hypothetical protein